MAEGKAVTSFDEIIQADRLRRKNEALAREIFSRGRRSSAPGAGIPAGPRKPGTGPSLASRIGVTKRSSSTTMKPSAFSRNGKTAPATTVPKAQPKGNVDAEWTHDLHESNDSSHSQARRGKPIGAAREARLYTAINGSTTSAALTNQFNIVGVSKPSSGLSIRGIAGPCAVRAQNFARGTTAADIESALAPVGGKVLQCVLISERPNVIAEIIFETKEGAENVIETFNNQTADGHLLQLYIKPGAVILPPSLQSAKSEPVLAHAQVTPPVGPRADLYSDRTATRYAKSDRYEPRDRSRERRYERDDRDEVMDGSYGFDDHMDTDEQDVDMDNRGRGRGLYSDELVGNRGAPRGPRGGRNNFEGGRGRGESLDRGDRGERGGRGGRGDRRGFR